VPSDPTPKDTQLDSTLAQLRQLLVAVSGPVAGNSSATAAAPLKVIQASVGNAIRMVPIEDVLCFEAADKYVRWPSSRLRATRLARPV
jgi:DNA-binding LytR/AlgR family response regulator